MVSSTRSRQSFVKRILGDTLPQRMNRVFVNDCEQLVGRREFAYLDVDYGDRKVEFESSHPIYLRADGLVWIFVDLI